MMTVSLQTARIHLLTFLRLRQAVFWSLVFPVFLYLVFGSIFGVGGAGDTDFTAFLFTGIIAMTVMADGLFAIGGLVKGYYANGTIRYLKKLPMSIISYFLGIIASRFCILTVVVCTLAIASYLVFDHTTVLSDLLPVIPGILIGLWVFSFIGLVVSFSSLGRASGEKGLANMLYFAFLFLSSALYPLGSFNAALSKITAFLPLEPILQVMRQEPINIPVLLFWLLVPPLLFAYFYNRMSIQR